MDHLTPGSDWNHDMVHHLAERFLFGLSVTQSHQTVRLFFHISLYINIFPTKPLPWRISNAKDSHFLFEKMRFVLKPKNEDSSIFTYSVRNCQQIKRGLEPQFNQRPSHHSPKGSSQPPWWLVSNYVYSILYFPFPHPPNQMASNWVVLAKQ